MHEFGLESGSGLAASNIMRFVQVYESLHTYMYMSWSLCGVNVVRYFRGVFEIPKFVFPDDVEIHFTIDQLGLVTIHHFPF